MGGISLAQLFLPYHTTHVNFLKVKIRFGGMELIAVQGNNSESAHSLCSLILLAEI